MDKQYLTLLKLCTRKYHKKIIFREPVVKLFHVWHEALSYSIQSNTPNVKHLLRKVLKWHKQLVWKETTRGSVCSAEEGRGAQWGWKRSNKSHIKSRARISGYRRRWIYLRHTRWGLIGMLHDPVWGNSVFSLFSSICKDVMVFSFKLLLLKFSFSTINCCV